MPLLKKMVINGIPVQVAPTNNWKPTLNVLFLLNYSLTKNKNVIY